MNFMTPVYAPPNSAATLRRASSAPIHKRSMQDPSRLSFANRRSESDKDLLGSLVPLGVVFMEQITISVDVAKDSHSDVRYELRVHHLKNNATWSFVRTFDEFRRFQQRLLKALDHGHFCNAECPWLYTFLKSYFPKKHLFNFATSRVISSRKDGLQRFFVSLQSFLLNRANHNCSFIANNVVDVVVEFVYGDYAKYYQIDGNTSEIQRAGSFSTKVPRASEFARCPEDDEASVGSAGSSSGATTCQLCESSLDGEAYASIRSYASGTKSESSGVPSTASSTSLMDDDSFFDTSDIGAMSSSAPAAFTGLSGNQARRVTHYVMTLGCGHQFHDECIVPKLNETLRCPTCDHLEVK